MGLPEHLNVATNASSAAMAALIAQTAIQPIQGVHTQWENQIISAKGKLPSKYLGAYGTLKNIYQEQGVRSLYSGLRSSARRHLIFCAIRLSTYEAVKTKIISIEIDTPGGSNLSASIGAGLTAGATASVVSLSPGQKSRIVANTNFNEAFKHYREAVREHKTIFNSGAIRQLIKTASHNAYRKSIQSVTEIVTYDLIKTWLVKFYKLRDAMPLHLAAALVVSGVQGVLSHPINMFRMRYFASSSERFPTMTQYAKHIYYAEGLRSGFYRGFQSYLVRSIIWNVILWLSYEQFKKYLKTLRTNTLGDGDPPTDGH